MVPHLPVKYQSQIDIWPFRRLNYIPLTTALNTRPDRPFELVVPLFASCESEVGLKSVLPLLKMTIAASVLLLAGQNSAYGRPEIDKFTDAGLLGLYVTNLGYFGHSLSEPNMPSAEYPLNSNVEHLFKGGLWVGAVTAAGDTLVSTGAQDASNQQEGDQSREFNDLPETIFETKLWTNLQNFDPAGGFEFNSRALATQHFEFAFNDNRDDATSHTPIGIKVILRALAWSSPFADDFVILDYTIINDTNDVLTDLYVGIWTDTTVGNTELRNPYDPQADERWDYYDDVNGGWGPKEWVPEEYSVAGDNRIWMMSEHDADGDEGLATSWIGTRLLGTVPAVEPEVGTPPVSYNSWTFRNEPNQDSDYENPDELGSYLPGKYQTMANGNFAVGEIDGVDYGAISNRSGMLATGPFKVLAAQDSLKATFAFVAGFDSLGLIANSGVAQKAYDDGFTILGGPPSPRLNFAYESDSIILRWAPGDSLDSAGEVLPKDDGARSPEHHISEVTGREDFQGYRIFRFQGQSITGNPEDVATLVGEFDKIDGIGFDTGLPPLNSFGEREYTDTNLLDGFPYWYSVISFSAPDQEEGLPEFRSGFNENSELVYPGSAPFQSSSEGTIGVYPNPYRAGSLFDGRLGEQELSRKIWFTGLPAKCVVQVFNVVGELVKTIEHDEPGNGQHSWNLLSNFDRVIATGLYIYVVKNSDTGEIQRGKLVIIK
ncbi:MAG: hypothetical protein ACI9UK_001237 [Candidatus Krumholzibacteriia bacterium]|jgi:hypothetical protein